jgi:hypothetical protein
MATAEMQQEIVAKKAKIRDLEEKVEAASGAGDRQLMLQLLLEQEKQLTAMEQEKLLLMQQQAGAALPAVQPSLQEPSRAALPAATSSTAACRHMCY